MRIPTPDLPPLPDPEDDFADLDAAFHPDSAAYCSQVLLDLFKDDYDGLCAAGLRSARPYPLAS